MEALVAELQGWVAATGPWLVAWVGLACFLKYLLPPFPSDSIVVVGAALSVGGPISPGMLFVVGMAASLAGMAVDYRIGRWLEERLSRADGARWRRWLPPDRLERLERGYRRWGTWFLVLHRFLPVARALIFIFAGISRIGLLRTLLLGSVATALWHGGLVWAAVNIGQHFDELTALLERLGRSLSLASLCVVTGVVLVWLVQRRRPDAASASSASAGVEPE